MEDKEENKGLKSEILKTTDGYREGAIAGALVGVVLAAYMRKSVWLGALFGMIAGGYIGYTAKGGADEAPKFKNNKN